MNTHTPYLPQIQGALFASEVPNDFMGSPRIRVMPSAGTAMEPTIGRNDYVVLAPCHSFKGEGVYALMEGEETVFFRARRFGDGVMLTLDNPALCKHPMMRTMVDFDECCLGKMVGRIEITDHGAMQMALVA